ncbi:hypothetical protein ACHAPQ_007831 [Fusarium lateritium]
MAMDRPSSSLSSSFNTNTNDRNPVPKPANNAMPHHLSKSLSEKDPFTGMLLNQRYPGSGSTESPFLINFIPDDPDNAMLLAKWKKWAFTCLQAFATLATTFASSAYSGGIEQVIHSFDISQEVATLGISLYVLGFACGPLVWGPLSELYGRRKIFFFTFMATTAFSAGAAGAGSFPALLVLRFLAGSIGSAPFSNAPAVIADMFDKSERGMAMCMFSGAPFLGPAIGPMAGGFLSQAGGWRWLHGLLAAFTGVTWITSIYISIIYGTMYMCFAAFPIVFQRGRGWDQGIGGLAFTGIVIGVILSIASFVFEDKRYTRAARKRDGPMEPEDRLPPAMVGSILIPLGLFWFAWTTFLSVHWIVPIIGSVFFAWGLVLVFMALLNYLVDSYVIFAASVMAANSALRSLFGAAFPLFTRQMYANLGVQWASSIPAFLALACVPFPFLFFRYGSRIRMRCKYAAEAAGVLEGMQAPDVTDTADDTVVEDEEICSA